MTTTTSTARGSVALWIGHAVQVLFGLYGGMIGVGWTYIEKTYGLGLESLGIFLAAGMAARLICNFVSGRVIAAIGLRAFVLIGVCVAGVALIVHGITSTWLLLLLAAFAVGIGDSLVSSGLSTYVVSHYNARRLNWLHGSFGIGLMIGPQLITLVVRDLGQTWQALFMLLGVGVLLGGLLMLPGSVNWRLDPHPAANPDSSPLRPASMRQTLSLRLLWWCMILFFLYGGVEVGTGQFANALFTEGRGIDPRVASTWVTIYWGSFAAGRLLIGGLVEQIGRTRLVRILMLLAVIGALLIWLLRDPNFGWIGMLTMGVACSAIFPTLTTQTPQRFGAQHTANAIGFQMGIAALGAGFLPSLDGYVASAISIELIAPLILVQAVIMFLLHEYILRIQPQPTGSTTA